MAERERSGYSRGETTHSLDEAIREGWDVAVKYTGSDGNNCTVRGISASCYDKKHIKVFNKAIGKWIFIPIEKIRRIGTCKQTGKIEENLPHSNIPRSNKPRCRSRKQFSYKKWWKDNSVKETTNTEY